MVLPSGLLAATSAPGSVPGCFPQETLHLVGALPQVNILQPHSKTGHRSFCLEFAEDSVLAIHYKSISDKQCKQFTSPAYQEVWV